MKRLIFATLAIFLSGVVGATEEISSAHAQKTLDIYRTIVGVESSKNLHNVQIVADYLAGEFLEAGFPRDDIEMLPASNSVALVTTYRGDGSSGKPPIVFMAHMDVVEANPDDWVRAPFELTQDETYFYGRGTRDNKFGVAQLASTFIALRKAGFVPSRDLILAFTGDEETTGHTGMLLVDTHEGIRSAEFALNSDFKSGALNAEGEAVMYRVQVAEKTYVTWEISAHNPGGHSSRPTEDNAILDLAQAIVAVQGYRFPVRWDEMTLVYFQATGQQLGGELGEAMIRFAYNPEDESASDRLFREPSYVGSTRTTCVSTMLRAGHAENALPQSATVTVNCRVYPGVPVAEVKAALEAVIANDKLEFKQLGEAVESPISQLRPDVLAAVGKAVHARYPDVAIVGVMGPGATDGLYFRNAGIPTLAVSSIFMNPDDDFAHGLNERIPIKALYDALDHWSIIIRELAGPQGVPM